LGQRSTIFCWFWILILWLRTRCTKRSFTTWNRHLMSQTLPHQRLVKV
jgi:hypothetical protein